MTGDSATHLAALGGAGLDITEIHDGTARL